MKFIYMGLVALLTTFIIAPAQADDSHLGCKAGCGNDRAAGRGTGRSVCVVTFIAPQKPEPMDALKGQLFDEKDAGLLRNKKGEIAIRGGQPGNTRVSVDCNAVRLASYAIFCATLEGKDKTRTLKGEEWLEIRRKIPPKGHSATIKVQL